MDKKNDGGAAFPSDTRFPECKGMTLRQWYAGMAIQGFCSYYGSININYDKLCNDSFIVADAMIKHEESECQK